MLGVAEKKISVNQLGIILFLFGTIVFENGSLIMKIMKIFIVGLAVIVTYRRCYILKNTYILWLVLYSMYACMTTFWAIDTKTAETMSQTIILNLLCLWAYAQFVNKKDQYIKLSCRLMTVLPIIAFAVVVAEHGADALVGLRTLEGEQTSLHNAIGKDAAFAICLIIALREKNENYKWKTKLLIALNLVIVALSGSRKAIIYLVIPIFAFLILRSRNPAKFVRNIFLTIFAVIIMYVAFMKIPVLYNMVGESLQTMIVGLRGGETDASTGARVRLVRWGMEVFRERPFFGHGLENYKILHLYRFGQMYIADNNYIELLVDQGIVGLILYYAFHVWLINKFIKTIKKNRNNRFLIMLFGMEMAIIVCDYGVVSYRSVYLQIIICIMSMTLENIKQKS